MKSLSLSKPHMIIMVGIPGAGKSFFAEHFSETFNAPLISYGRLRDELFAEPKFDSDEAEIIERVSGYVLGEVFKTNRTIIFEGQTDTRTQRQDVARTARQAGYEPLFIWVQTEPVTAKQRIQKAMKLQPTISPSQFDRTLRHFSVPHVTERAVVISGKHTYASQLRIVLKRLVEPKVAVVEAQAPPPRPTPANRTIIVR